MTTVSIRLSETELEQIRREKDEASRPWPVSRHRLMKQAMFRGLDEMKKERESVSNTGR